MHSPESMDDAAVAQTVPPLTVTLAACMQACTAAAWAATAATLMAVAVARALTLTGYHDTDTKR